ncbi:20633_t:CDS:2 [Funneliformis geosporum]|nr:20633_t:CDS:2 [Funneliformis geosporum]
MKEIIIIKTDSGQKIKTLLEKGRVNYQIVYDDILADEKFSEEEIYRRDMRLANQDKDRQKEVELTIMTETEINKVKSVEQIKPKFGEVYKCAFYGESVAFNRQGQPKYVYAWEVRIKVDNQEGKVMTDQIIILISKAQITNPDRRNALITGGGVAADYFTTAAGGSVIVNTFWNGANGPNDLFRNNTTGLVDN